MSKKLVIVESPAKAKTISKMLGKDFVVRASMGHVRDLPERAFGVDIEHDFQPQYEESKARSRNLSELKSAAKAADEIYLAPDPDREGEAIAWHLQEVLGRINKKAPFKRVSFHEITRSAIEKAFKTPGSVNMALVDAQQARRVLDRIVGYQVSPLLWTRIERGVSAGRVQSVALRLVCEREREIQSFIPEEYWNFRAQFTTSDAKKFSSVLAKINDNKFKAGSKREADVILNAVKGASAWTVTDKEIQPRKKNAAPPFITSTLQQAASSALGYSASQTMRIAQQLYEGVDAGNGPIGLITYMRTDSVAVAVEAQNACRNFIAANYGQDFVPERPNVYKSKSTAQGAHEAIRPTDVNLVPEKIKSFLDPQQYRLYNLIWKRFVASQMPPAGIERTTVVVDGKGSDGNKYTFRSSASVTKFQGFLRAYNIAEEGIVEDQDDTPDASVLAEIAKNASCTLCDTLSEQKFTEPAPRFSEATLIKELESNGIGRPSTYATIVNTIQVRKYVSREKGKLVPTDLGFKINDYLVDSLPELFQVGFTAGMEEKLDSIEEGGIQWTKMMHDFYADFSKWLASAKNAGAPANDKAALLINRISGVKNWTIPEKVPGKRAFDDKKFFSSIAAKFERNKTISGRQWEALLALALKYGKEIPTLADDAVKYGFTSDLEAAEERRSRFAELHEEQKRKRAEAEAAAPAQDGICKVFDAMSAVKWDEPEKRRGRIYDDKSFFQSLEKQSRSGKSLSEKQLLALSKLIEKYSSQITDRSAIAAVPVLTKKDVPADPASVQKTEDVKKLLKGFENVTKWTEPVKRGRRVYDDKEFVSSIAKQVAAGKILSDRQVAALTKMAAKYSI